MREKLEWLKRQVDEMKKDHQNGDIRAILEMIQILADCIESESTSRIWSAPGTSGHGY